MVKTSKPVAQRPHKSEFGSHSDMIDEMETSKLNDPKRAVLKDQFGFYTTDVSRLDNGQADPNRWDGTRIKIEK